MAGIFDSLGQYQWIVDLAKMIGWFLLFLVIAAIITALVLWMVVQLKKLRIIEINTSTPRMQWMSGRFKKNKKGIKMLYVSKLKKYLPRIQEEDKFTKGKQDAVILVKDNNGLHHTARLPSHDEIKEWYKVVHDIDIDDKDTPQLLKDRLRLIYLLPNPSEDLDWLANETQEAKLEFSQSWWNSPVVMVIGTAFLCAFMFIISLIITKKV